MPSSINIGGSAPTTIGLGIGTGISSGAYTSGFKSGFSPSSMSFNNIGGLNQSVYAAQNSLSQFNQFIQAQRQQMYGGASNIGSTSSTESISNTGNTSSVGSTSGNSWFTSNASKGIMSAAGEMMNMANNAIFSKSSSNRSANDQSASEIRSNMSDMAIKSGNPIAMAIGLGTKIVDEVMDATGARSSQISKEVKEKTGITGAARFLNNAMNFLPGNPLAMGGKKLTDAELSQETENIRGAFTGTLDDIDTAQSIGGSRVNFMLNRKTRSKMNDYVKEQNRKNALLTDISRTNTLRKQSDYAQDLNKQNLNRYSGNTYQNMAVGKEGLKLPNREMLDAIYAKKVTAFKDGGIIGVDSNVIPEGALHKELNHMEEYNEELDKVITDKGIAVVTTDKDGKVEQVAEIEKEEIVFRLELTKKIEELWHEGTPEAMLKAGKLLVKEIMGNTDDNTEEILDGDN